MAHQLTATDSMFSVREKPWHGLGAVLDDYPTGVDDALDKAGLLWEVPQEFTYRKIEPEWTDDFGKFYPARFEAVEDYLFNVREDTNDVLGVVSNNYKVVSNRDAFRFLDSLINSDLHFETAGSLQGGKRVWVMARLPEFVEVGGDGTGIYIYVANSHDGSLAVTASVTPIRIVCNNTLSWALSKSEGCPRTYRFRHTGDLAAKYQEARDVMGLTINYAEQFKSFGDNLALEPMTKGKFERKVVNPLFPIPEELGKRGKTIRTNNREKLLDLFAGKGEDGDTRGNAPNTKWTAANAVAEYADHLRRETKRTDLIRRRFEDTDLKQHGLDLVVAA